MLRRVLDHPMQRALVVTALSAVTACSPTLDWRQWRPEGSGVEMMLPCKPVSQVRNVRLAGQAVRLSLHACSAGGQTWALAFADLTDPAQVGPALNGLQAAALVNVGGAQVQAVPWVLAGATPHVESGRLRFQGRLPDGRAVQEDVAVFAVGTRVLQATAIGETLPAEAVDSFFQSFRVTP